MFDWLKGRGKAGGGKPVANAPQAPEVMGLRLGCSFEVDPLKLKLVEGDMVVEGVAPTQIIEAVGRVRLDDSSTLLRFYTDDEAFLQVVLNGGLEPQHIVDAKLWHFYDTQSVSSRSDWDRLLQDRISQPSWELEGRRFTREWVDVSGHCPPVAMIEETFHADQPPSRTDQFVMLYSRRIDEYNNEYLLVSGEEVIVDDRPQWSLVLSTGMDMSQADLRIHG